MNSEDMVRVHAAAQKLFAIGRRDLPPGLRAAQMVHALRQYQNDHEEAEQAWYQDSNTIVLLEVEDQAALEGLIRRAEAEGVGFSTFTEDGFEGHTAAALGSEACRLVSSLPLAFKTGN